MPRMGGGPTVEGEYVFSTGFGKPLLARNVLRTWQNTLRRLGLPRTRVHDLRHMYSSLLAAQGVHPRVIMDRLGHSQLSTTTGYTHVIPELQREATRVLDQFLDALAGADQLGMGLEKGGQMGVRLH